jgi:hypothetical protein
MLREDDWRVLHSYPDAECTRDTLGAMLERETEFRGAGYHIYRHRGAWRLKNGIRRPTTSPRRTLAPLRAWAAD